MTTYQISKLKEDDLDAIEKLSDAAYDRYNIYVGARDILLPINADHLLTE